MITPNYPDCPASGTCVLMLPPEFLALSAADGAELGFLVVTPWVIAWGIRRLADAFLPPDRPESEA